MAEPSAEDVAARHRAWWELIERHHPVTLGEAFDAGYNAAERERDRLRKVLGDIKEDKCYCDITHDVEYEMGWKCPHEQARAALEGGNTMG